jgi:hypothetical protein
MVFIKRHIPAVQRLNNLDPSDVPKEKLSQVANQANLAGILTQLSLLTNYANEIFTSLVEDSQQTFKRISTLSERAAKMNQSVAKVESFFNASAPLKLLESMNNTARADYAAQNAEQHQHLTRTTIPSSVLAVYEGCAGM